MSRGLGQMQQAVLAFLRPAKHAHAKGKFMYIGGADMENVDEVMTRAYTKAHEQLAAQGGKSNEPDPEKALDNLADMHTTPTPANEVLAFQGGEYKRLGEGVYDLRATLRYMAIIMKEVELAQRFGAANDKLASYPDDSPEQNKVGLEMLTMLAEARADMHPLVNPNEHRLGNYFRINDRFRISFYRAARSLVTRGLLIRRDDADEKQLRFVCMRRDLERKYAKQDDDEE